MSNDSQRCAVPGLSAWQPIETAPLDGTEILIARGNERYVAAWLDSDEIGPVWTTPDCTVVFRPDLWMPLEAVPNSVGHSAAQPESIPTPILEEGKIREMVIETLMSCDGPAVIQPSVNGYEERLARWERSRREVAEQRTNAILQRFSLTPKETR